MSLGFGSYDDSYEDGQSKETLAEANIRLTNELKEAKEEAEANWFALKYLMSICKSRGFDPFANESKPLQVHPSYMKKEDVVARNVEATKRLEGKHHVASTDKITMPNYSQMEGIYKEDPKMTEVLDFIEKVRHIQSIPDKKESWWKIIFASCKNPVDPDEHCTPFMSDDD